MTGYIRLDLPNRSHEEYERLGADLLAAVPGGVDVSRNIVGAVESCWHWQLSYNASLPIGNPGKDTRAFHAVQHEKTAWMADAAERTDADILVWMDYGLLHVPGITPELVAQFLGRASVSAPLDRVGMASIWGAPVPGGLVWSSIGWWCAGGVFTVPRHLARPWHESVVDQAVRLRSRGFCSWEVNDWAAAWIVNPSMVQPWLCDHDASLLEAGP